MLFVICGKGDRLGQLKKLAEELDNMLFPG